MELIKTEDAVGQVLCHDITQIIPGVKKGAAFKKGHIVQKEDIPVLLSLGKEHLYVWKADKTVLHEDDAAAVLRDMCLGQNLTASVPSEGKIELKATVSGLLKIESKRLRAVNALGELMIATLHGNTSVTAGQTVAGMRIIPLVIAKEKLTAARRVAGKKPLVRVLPFKPLRAAIVTTGSEVYKGLVQDAFGPVLRAKLAAYGVAVLYQTITDDRTEHITAAIQKAVADGADMVCCTGGMSVDPDDRTPAAIRETGAHIVTYGAPVLPGAMFLLSYLAVGGRSVPIVGLPGCVMYAKRTVFDVVLPRIVAGDVLTADDIAAYGEGGLCQNCTVCTFPKCGFGV